MKKSLVAFYIKLALAIGVPVIGVGTIITVFNSDPKVEYEEVDISDSDEKGQDGSNTDKTVTPPDIIENESTTKKPSEEEPTTNEPATEEPTKEEPTTKEPATEEPTKEEPTTKEPTTEGPTKEEPTTKEPTTEEPTGEEPTEEPATESEESFKVMYTYDLLGRLIRAEYEYYIIEYSYDNNGNILEIKKSLK